MYEVLLVICVTIGGLAGGIIGGIWGNYIGYKNVTSGKWKVKGY
jgi:hypothetical protein